jgi:two-component sensor histidine kinase
VKNNFQMIASLLALQRRELPTRLRTLLRVPEDRVLAMAAAYKASYATGEIGHVSALDLLRDVTAQLRQSFGLDAPLIQTAAEDEPVWLDLDQAVPLGLLVSEILTSTLDRADGAAHPIQVSVLKPDPRTVHVEITSRRIADAIPSTGLAARLVAAYRAQLNAAVSCPEDDRVVIAMPIERDAQNHPGRVELGA